MNKKIKIFISYKNKHPLLKSHILTPIQTGRAIADEIFDEMIGDDTGENISKENPKYNELSAQYWVWKNYNQIGNPDYIGFMHYRRHFIFDNWQGNPDHVWLPHGHVYLVQSITPAYLCHVSDENIQKSMNDCDCLVLKPYDVKNLQSETIRARYSELEDQQVETFDIFIQTLQKLYPQYLKEIKQIEKGSVQYLCNMFIMKKELFFEYSDFCFSVLQAVNQQIDSSKMNEAALRFLGYLGEFCLSIYVFRLIHSGQYKVKELNGSFVLSDEHFDMKKLRKKYLYYRVMSKITFGKKKQKYKHNRRKIKQLMQI